MVQDSAQIRRQGARDFMAYYEYACARQETVPLSAIKANLDKGMLDFNGDRLKQTDWPPVLNSISINKHLHHIAISSTYQANLGSGDTDRRYFKSTFKRKVPVIRCKDMTFKLCKALRECLTISSNLKTLHLNGLPLRERDLITLTKGLGTTTSLENLSLANCPISDEGLEVICQSVKYSTNIKLVDFTGCNLTWRGAEHMANIIKHQGLQRHGTAWAESLRYRKPQFEGMGGLRRVTLNANSLIGDRGASAFARELAEDLWVKAVDLQRCGLSNEGARRLLEALKTNSSLCVLDIRDNPLVDKVLVKTILEKVLMNPDGQSSEYCWIKPPSAESHKASGPKRRALSSTGRGKATFRTAPHKKTPHPGGRGAGAALTQKPGSSCSYVPWRAAARAGRQRGLPPGVSVRDQSFQGAATVKVTVESVSEGEEEEDEEEEVVVEVEQRPSSFDVQDRITGRQCDLMQMELKECRLRLAEERRARLKAESRLIEFELENARLRDANNSLSEALAAAASTSAPAALSALEDEAVLQSIESSFTKFHAFLDLLRDAGFGQLASMAGIDSFDLQPLGRPQLSSTIGAHSDAAASLTIEKHADVGAKTRDVPLKVTELPVDPATQEGAITTLRSPPFIGASTNKDRLLDMTQASGPGEDGEEEPEQHIKPDTRHHSGSEHSVHSQKSYAITSQTQSSHTKSNSSSHRSNGSHENSFKNIHSYKHPSHSHGSHGSSSVSGSDIISDKAESVGSAGSWSRGKERSVPVGLSEREPSQSKTAHGRVEVEHFSSLQGLEVLSNDDSF